LYKTKKRVTPLRLINTVIKMNGYTYGVKSKATFSNFVLSTTDSLMNIIQYKFSSSMKNM
jgi:hypothetical protein